MTREEEKRIASAATITPVKEQLSYRIIHNYMYYMYLQRCLRGRRVVPWMPQQIGAQIL